ncbi:MAG: hypothetical protein HGB12_12745, partial [Bacteroidetes bacterium]|nr:hypothetical protein [Bacteroidota bacterium]
GYSIEDADGNLWFGSNGEGLYKYDGKLFVHFGMEQGLSSNTIYSILQDNTGNYYVYGNFNGTVNQDLTSISTLGGQDIFLSKYNSNGDILWMKQIGGTGSETSIGICMNHAGDALIVSGQTNGNCSFDGMFPISTSGLNDIFLSKFDLNGNCLWSSKAVYGADHQIGGAITIDNNENIVMAGAFKVDASFNNNPASDLSSSYLGIRQYFVAEFDQNGDNIWSKLINCDDASNSTNIKTVTTYNNEYYCTGQYTGNLDVDGFAIGNATGLSDGFVFKLDTYGNIQWLKEIKGTSSIESITKHCSDATGNLFITGNFQSDDLNLDGTILTNKTTTSKSDVFIAKYNSSGTLQWAKSVGSTGDDKSTDISTYNGNVILTGSYSDVIDFDSFSLTNAGATDAFIAECDDNGTFLNALQAAGTKNDVGEACIYLNNGRNFLTAGDFYSTSLTIGTNTFTNSVQDLTTRDAYLARYGCFDGTTINSTSITCNGLNNGTATATPTQTGSYTYLWSNSETTATIQNLSAGVYSVTVTSSGSCTATASVTITEPSALTSSITGSTNVSCYGVNNGSATVTPTGGTSPYTYLWSNSQTDATAVNLVAGSYSVTSYDNNGCSTFTFVTITEPAALTATISQNNGCNGSCNKSATANPTNGTPPYSYSWSNSQTDVTATALCAGNYTVTITDGCLNTFVQSVTITEPTVLDATTSQVEPSLSSCDGTATVSPTGGTSPYTYLWNTSPSQSTATATGICGGICAVTVTDANNCTITKAYTFKKAINLRVVGTTTNTATFAWDGNGATSYRLRFNKVGETTYFYSNVYTSPNTRQLLDPNTNYECCITTNESGVYSPYSSPVTFATLNNTSVLAQNLRLEGTPTSSSATVAWDGSGASSYQLRLNILGSTTYSYKTAYASPYTFDLLLPNTNYECCIRTFNGGTYTSISSPISFTTANEVTVVATNLRVEGTPGTNSVTMAWDGSGADYYRLRFNKSGSTSMLTVRGR